MSIRKELLDLMRRAKAQGNVGEVQRLSQLFKELDGQPEMPTGPKIEEQPNAYDEALAEIKRRRYSAQPSTDKVYEPPSGPSQRRAWLPTDAGSAATPRVSAPEVRLLGLKDWQRKKLSEMLKDPLTYELARDVLFEPPGGYAPLDPSVRPEEHLSQAEMYRLDKLARLFAGLDEDAEVTMSEAGATSREPAAGGADRSERWADKLEQLAAGMGEGAVATSAAGVEPEPSMAQGGNGDDGTGADTSVPPITTEASGQGEAPQGQGGSRQPMLMKIGGEWLWGYWDYSANRFVVDESLNPFLGGDTPPDELVYRSDLSGAMVYLGKDENGEMLWGWFDPVTRKITPDQGANPVKQDVEAEPSWGDLLPDPRDKFPSLPGLMEGQGEDGFVEYTTPKITFDDILKWLAGILGGDSETTATATPSPTPTQEPTATPTPTPTQLPPGYANQGILDLVDQAPLLTEWGRPPDDEVFLNNIDLVVNVASDFNLRTDELAYVMATAHYESQWGADMTENYEGDLKEYFIEKYYRNKRIAQELGNTHIDDAWYFHGRGFVQLTGRRHYQSYTDHFAEINFTDSQGNPVDLIANPNAAVDPKVAAYILVHGMITGEFTEISLSQFLPQDGGTFDFYSARQVVNPGDDPQVYQRIADMAQVYADLLDELCKMGALPEGIVCIDS